MQVFFLIVTVLIICMTGLWWISVKKNDVSIVDIFWGSAFVLVVNLLAYELGYALNPRQWLVLALVSVWGLRLSAHIFWRGRGKGEDYRYQELRKKDPKNFWRRSFFSVFLLQGALVCFISLPLMIIFRDHRTSFGYLDIFAILVWLVGFSFEAGGDWQLMRFRSNPKNKGKILDSGFWSLTRHPNYFGDAVVWWSFYVFACAVPGGWATILSPIVMTFLLMKVSGVSLLERNLVQTKPQYENYIQSTPAFFPFRFTIKN